PPTEPRVEGFSLPRSPIRVARRETLAGAHRHHLLGTPDAESRHGRSWLVAARTTQAAPREGRPRSRQGISAALSLDDLVGAQQKRLRDRDPKRLGGLEIDHQLEL